MFFPTAGIQRILFAQNILLTTLTLLAFAGNLVLCRIALRETGIDAASFTTIRLASGAVVLWLIVRCFRRAQAGGGSWLSAPPLAGAALMLMAGAAWGVYSIRGKGAGDAARVTAGNFLRAVPFAAVLGGIVLVIRAPYRRN